MEDFSLPLEEDGGTNIKASNSRTILHFDIDCFYAQVCNRVSLKNHEISGKY